MNEAYENYDLIFRDPVPYVIFLTEDPNGHHITELFNQVSLNKNGNKSPRLKIVSPSDLPDFTGLTVDYLGFKLINNNAFVTFPGAILLYLDLTAIETTENSEFITIINNNVLYFAKDLNPFIINRTKITLILNLSQNAPSTSIISSGVKNFDFCAIEHVLFCSSDDIQRTITKAEEHCYNQNHAFCERHIRHLRRLKPSESEMFKDKPHVDPLEVEIFNSLRNSFIAHIHQLMRDDKESLKNYELAWHSMINSREFYQFDIDSARTKVDIDNVLDPNAFLSVPMTFLDIIVVRLLKLTIMFRDIKTHFYLLDILGQYYNMITNGMLSKITSSIHYLYRLSYIHRYISEQLPQLPIHHNMGLGYVNLKSYHLYMFFKYLLLLSAHNQNLSRLVSQNEINELVSVFVEFNNLGWNVHSFVLLVHLFKYYLTFNCIPEAIDTFNNLYRNQIFKLPNYINYKLGQESQSVNNNILIWKNNWKLYEYVLSLGYTIPGNRIELICSSLKAFKGDRDAYNKIKDRISNSEVLSNFPLDLPLQGRATLYLSEKLLILVFKLNLSNGFFSNSGVISCKNDQKEFRYNFLFEPVSSSSQHIRSPLVGVLEGDLSLSIKSQKIEIGLTEYILFLQPFVNVDELLKSAHVDLSFNLSIENSNDVLYIANVFVTTNKFITKNQLLNDIFPVHDRQNVVLRSSVKVTPLTEYWIDGLAPVTLDFYIMNYSISHDKIEILISDRLVPSVFISQNEVRTCDSPVTHLKFQLNVQHDKSLSEHSLTIKPSTYDSCSTTVKYEYHEGIVLNFVKEVIPIDFIPLEDLPYYTLSALNNTKFPIRIKKLSTEDKKDLGSDQIPISLLPSESFTLPLNESIDENNLYEKIIVELDVEDKSIPKPVEWISTATLKVVAVNDTFGLDVKCSSDSVAKVGSEFNYEVQIKNNTSTTQELQVCLSEKIKNFDEEITLFIAGPVSINIILLPFDNKKLRWKIVSLVAGQIELPRITLKKIRWLQTGDDQLFESLPISVSVLPKTFELN